MITKIKLGTVLKVVHGYAFKSENYVKEGKYRLVTLGNFSEENNNFKYNDEKATYYGAEFPKEFILKEGDLIMPLTEQTEGLFGNTAFIPNDDRYVFVLNQRVGKVICDESKVDRYFIRYLLSTKLVKKQLEARASGTRQRNISPNDIYDVEVFIPDLITQRKIGKVLYTIEIKQINNQKIVENLEELSNILFDYWFLQFDFPNENGNPYKLSGGKMVWNEMIKKELPESWEIKRVKDILEVVTGKEDANLAVENGKYNFFTCAKETSKCNNYEFEGKSILIAGNGDFNVKYFDGKYNAYQRTYVLVPNEPKYVGLIYHAAIRKIDYFRKGANGSIVKFITKSDIENIEIVVPKDEKLLEPINLYLNIIQQLKKENEELKSLRDFLLPLLMNGQVKL